jgi:hypothetical protein
MGKNRSPLKDRPGTRLPFNQAASMHPTKMVTSLFRLTLLLAILAAAPAYAEEKASVTVIGTCKTVIIAGKPDHCMEVPQVTYSLLDNGRAMLAFVIGDGRLVAFVSEKDAQPRPQNYYMYLSRVRIATMGSQFTANIGGQCLITLTPDKTVWPTITCNATDENGATYSLDFQSNGEPNSIKTPGSKPVASEDHPTQAMISQVTVRFKTALKASGIQGVAKDVAACYDKARFSIPLIRSCVLYDAASITMDTSMRQTFRERGTDPGPPPPFLSPSASKARSERYAALAFGGSEELEATYLGTAPTTVMQGLLK